MDKTLNVESKGDSSACTDKARPLVKSYDVVPGLAEFVARLREAYPTLSSDAIDRIAGLPGMVQQDSFVMHAKEKEEK